MRALDARIAVTVGDADRSFSLEAELALEAGVLVLFGSSGVGKTLTLQALAGLLPRVRGHVRVGEHVLLDGDRGVDLPAHARRVGYVPQQHALFPFLDVTGNVGFGLARAERRGAKVAALLEELGLSALASARPDALSGGERQRVALGRALAVEPRLLLLDEPFASIDDEGRSALRGVVLAAIERRKIPAVLVTHHVGEAVALGDQLVRFERGRTIAAGEPRAMLQRAGVRLTGSQRGPAEALSEGRARVRLADAVIEGPTDRVAGEDGASVRLDLEPTERT